MSKSTGWLLGAAAVALTSSAAFATEQNARAEATQDSAKAQSRDERGERRRQVHVYSHGDDARMIRHGGGAAHLKDILQLRPDQEPALKAFLEATHGEGDHRTHMVKFDRNESRSTPQRLEEMEAKLAEQQAQAKARIAAIRTFYGQLDAKQQKAFDALPMLMMVGPSMGPIMIPHPVHIAHNMPEPPVQPKPPEPPKP